MKAIVMSAVGKPEVLVLRDLPEPVPAHGRQVKVRLKAAGVNPIDTKLRSRGVFYENALPAVLGCDGAGVVEAIGEEVSRLQVGDHVWFCHGGLGREQGNYAEASVVDERWISAMPKTLSFDAAAAGPLVLITAWGALFDRARLRAGQTVLIHAGAGGVGHVAIQLAKLAKARVLTTVSNGVKADFVRSLGADEVIIYTEQDFVTAVNDLTGGIGVDVVLDTVGPDIFARSVNCTAHFGDLVTLLGLGSDMDLTEARMRNLRIGFELMLAPMLRGLDSARDHHVEILDRCAAWIDEGKLTLHVQERLPLAEARKAHELIEKGHTTGKIVLLP